MTIHPIDWEPEGTFNGLTRLWRHVPPAHYTLRINSFSLFHIKNIDHYESSLFESGGYKWKIVLHPNGNRIRNVKDHVSLYLILENTDDLPGGWEVNITFKFFLYNHICDKFLTFQDAIRDTSRLFWMKTGVGFDELLPCAFVNNPSNGFLLEDSCILGAEIFVVKSKGCHESLSIIADPQNTFTWKISDYSHATNVSISSDVFVVGGYNWKLLLYPKGDVNVKRGESISLYLVLVDKILLGHSVFAEFSLRVMDVQKKAQNWFCHSRMNWGSSKFMSVDDINNQPNTSLVKGTLTVEVEITIVSEHKDYKELELGLSKVNLST